MGSLIITATFVDYFNGSAWSSLGVNQTAAQLAITQMCQDYSNGLATMGSNVNITIQFGYGAVGNSAVDTTGTALGGGVGAQSNIFITDNLDYTSWRALLQGYGSKNTMQTTAWITANLPATPAFGAWTGAALSWPLAGAIGDSAYTDGHIIGSVGLGVGVATNYDQHGLGAGSFYGEGSHEVSELLGRRADGSASSSMYPLSNWVYASPGVRSTLNINTARYISHDNGTTDVADLNTLGAPNDPGDYQTYGNDAYDATGPSSGSVSRSSTVPLQQRDWQNMTIIGWPLTTLGLQWAGVSLPSAGPFGLIGLRR